MAKFKNHRVWTHEKLQADSKMARAHPSPWLRPCQPTSLMKRWAKFNAQSTWLTGMSGARVHGGQPRAAR